MPWIPRPRIVDLPRDQADQHFHLGTVAFDAASLHTF
jgi:hypothetical protein